MYCTDCSNPISMCSCSAFGGHSDYHGDPRPRPEPTKALDAALAAAPAQPDEREALQELIADFRLSNWTDEQGDGLPLVDRITSGGDIGAGMGQIELLADEIACFYADRALLAAPAPAAQPDQAASALAIGLKAFRDAHWTHWTQEENQLVVDCFHALRAALPQEAQRTLGGQPCADTYAGCAPDCHEGNRCRTSGVNPSDGGQQ